jgi:hypothetical protein
MMTEAQITQLRDKAKELQEKGLIHAQEFINFCDYVLEV